LVPTSRTRSRRAGASPDGTADIREIHCSSVSTNTGTSSSDSACRTVAGRPSGVLTVNAVVARTAARYRELIDRLGA
jgi:hypothetical protein